MPETALCQEAVSCVSAYDSFWHSFSKDFLSSVFHVFHFDTYDQKCLLRCMILVIAIMNQRLSRDTILSKVTKIFKE